MAYMPDIGTVKIPVPVMKLLLLNEGDATDQFVIVVLTEVPREDLYAEKPSCNI